MIKNYIALISIAVLLLLPINIHAKEIPTYTNSNGVEMSFEDYLNLKKLYSDEYIDVLTQDEYDYRMGLGIDFDNVKQEVKYIRTQYNHVTGEIIETEVTEEEYMQINNNQANSPQATIVEDTMKRITLGFGKSSSTTAVFSFSAVWKYLPDTRSYDVIAARFTNMTKINGTQQGKQIYTLNGTTSYVQYSFNGTNINNLSNGFGISMNLLNSDDLTYLECTIDASMQINSYPAWVFASYQHAVNDVTLSTSQDYTLGSGGFGNVILFNNGVGSNYDGMNGTYSYMTS